MPNAEREFIFNLDARITELDKVGDAALAELAKHADLAAGQFAELGTVYLGMVVEDGMRTHRATYHLIDI